MTAFYMDLPNTRRFPHCFVVFAVCVLDEFGGGAGKRSEWQGEMALNWIVNRVDCDRPHLEKSSNFDTCTFVTLQAITCG